MFKRASLRPGSTRRYKIIKRTTDVYRLIAGSYRLVGTNQWMLAQLWRTTRHFTSHFVGKESGPLDKNYSTM